MKDESHKADHGMRLDALRQSVVNRGNLNLRLQHLKASLNVSKGFVAGYDVFRAKVFDVGDQKQLSIRVACKGQGLLGNLVSEKLAFEIHPNDAS